MESIFSLLGLFFCERELLISLNQEVVQESSEMFALQIKIGVLQFRKMNSFFSTGMRKSLSYLSVTSGENSVVILPIALNQTSSYGIRLFSILNLYMYVQPVSVITH